MRTSAELSVLLHPGELLHVAGTTLRLFDLDDDLLGGVKPKVFFKAYLDDLEKNGALLPVPALFGIHAGSHAGLVYNEHDTKAFAEIHGLVSAASARALQRKMKTESSDLLKRLQTDSNDGSPLHEWGLDEGNYGGVAILHDIAVGDMADLLLVDSRFNDVLMAALSTRYERTRGDNALDLEKHWVRQLHAELKDRLKAAVAPYRAWGEGRLGYYFAAIETWAKPSRRPRKPKALSKQP